MIDTVDVAPEEPRTQGTPRQRIAPDTHPRERERLALQEAAHPDCDLLNVQTLIWLFRAYNATMNAQARELREISLSPSAFNVLMALVNTPGNTIEPYDLAERLLISRPSITGLLDTLQRKNLIRRDPHPDDRRRVLVTLTDTARDLLQKHYPVHYANQRAQLEDLSADEKAQLVSLLRRVKGAAPEHLTT